MPPEFDFMSEDEPYWHEDAWRELHAALEREPRDPDWAYAAESALGSAVNSRREIITYGTPTIHCRSETCQIQLLAYGGDDIDAGEWSTRFGAVYREVRDSFELEDFSIAQEGGLTAMVLHLSKKVPPGLDSAP
jgi:hypothetical protein